PRGGRIRLSIGREQDQAVIRIADNGAGIPPQMLERIFDIFQQVDQTLDRAHGGLGLGLTLVQRLIDLHGGEVVAKSAGEGQGSEFIVRLPLLASTPEPRPAEPPARRGSDLPRHIVLVVDDVFASAKTLAMMLESI